MTVAQRLMMGACGGVAGDAPFFGEISMLREFWAEDPAWTDPGDGNAVTGTIPDNGSLAADLTVSSGSGLVTYRSSWSPLNDKPVWDFSTTTQRGFKTTSGSSGTEFSVFAVVHLSALSIQNTITDAGTANNAFTSANSSNQWRAFNNGGAIQPIGGTADGDGHLIVVHFKTNDATFYVDGASVATDASGTVAAATGFVLGSNFAVTDGVRGQIPYGGMYSGDLTADGGYADWESAVIAYYGI